MKAIADIEPQQRNDSPQWTMVCRVDELLPGAGAAAILRHEPVAIFRLLDDSVFVLGNVDPFSGASILSRGIVGDVDGNSVVASPIYKQHFRLIDGSCVEDPTVSVASYRSVVVDGAVIVQVGKR